MSLSLPLPRARNTPQSKRVGLLPACQQSSWFLNPEDPDPVIALWLSGGLEGQSIALRQSVCLRPRDGTKKGGISLPDIYERSVNSRMSFFFNKNLHVRCFLTRNSVACYLLLPLLNTFGTSITLESLCDAVCLF